MKDEKNKQQRPHQPQQSDSGQKGQGSSGQGMTSKHPAGQDPSGTGLNNPRKSGMDQPMDVNEGDRNIESNIENPDQQEQPGKKINIDDDPDQTRKKVPDMHK
ncbi:MAG TPA: hypothetical protein VHE54_02360 [Puia sp.]|nr:hypothetical protein [Puia sp.]